MSHATTFWFASDFGEVVIARERLARQAACKDRGHPGQRPATVHAGVKRASCRNCGASWVES
jgi:hypothetical protein